MAIDTDKVLKTVRQAPAQGMKMSELAEALGLDQKGRSRLRRLLDELGDDGKVERAPGGRYRAPEQDRVVVPRETKDGAVGRIRVHPAGYGFVERDDGEADVFVPARFRGVALDGDRVRLSTWLGYKGVEGKVEEVLARGRAKLTGVVRAAGRHLHLEPDDPRIASTYGRVGLDEGAGGAREGQCVVAEIVRYPTREGGELSARVAHILGDPDDPRTEVAKIITCADIPDTFPEDALAAAQRTPTALGADDFADRIDLRDRPFLTIDPETARDHDDAVCLEERPGGWRLWVAIADVSHYVRPGGAIDREARIRGCSVYLPNRAIAMLPHELSAEICSIKPDVDRCAMVVRLDLDAHGVVKDKSFCAAVIRSRARLDYPGVAAALAGDFRGPRARYQEWADALAKMDALARRMRVRREKRGTLDFDIAEATVILDEDNPRLVRDVRRSKSSPEIKQAYKLVEEFMLAANEAVAEFFRERGLDTVWRVHDVPDVERLESFATLARSYGIDFDAEEATSPRAVRAVLAELSGRPFERSLHALLLRSLKQATYDVVNIGHFGLAASEYLHFTSPIRRYPDLIVHRLLKYHLRREGLASGGASHPAPPPREQLAAMAAESSAHERRAVEAEREVVDMYRAYLMRDRVGEELDGVIAGVTSFGVFVECLEPFVEGMIKHDALGGDRFDLDEKAMRLTGRRTGATFALGDAVRVRVENVSVARRRIDLALVRDEVEAAAAPPVEAPRPRRRGRDGGKERGGASRGKTRRR
jgi:ribonuclease R